MILRITFLFVFFQTLLIAQVSEFPFEESSLLWKIEGPGIKKGSYLFGTMHLIEKEHFYFPPKLTKIVEKSEALVMELPGLPNQMEAMKYVTLKEGSFFDFFNEEQTDSILVWAKEKMGMNEESFRATMSKMKPFVVVQMATQMQFIGKTESYEITLDKLAKEKGLKIFGLETVAEQMSFFDKLTPQQQTRMVMNGLEDGVEAIELTRKMQVLYKGQHVDSLFMMIQQEGGVLADEQSSFLDQRNEKWIPQIIDLAAKQKVFIAVGAGHLGGPNGVIRLLQKQGYTVTPVKL
jgi:uncharacterized protein YbaP (TraB family)